MKRIIMLMASSLMLVTSFSQSILYKDKTILNNTILLTYNIFDTLEVLCLNKPINNSFIFINDRPITSSKIDYYNKPVFFRNKIYLFSEFREN